MKVLILSPFPLDWERAHGGVESTVVYFLDGAAARGDVSLHVVTSLPSVQSPQTHTRGPVRITYLPRLRWGRAVGYAGDFRAIRRIVEQEQPDLVHGQGTTFYAGAALASGVPAVITAHGVAFRELAYLRGLSQRARGLWDAWYERRCIHRTRYLIAIAPYVAREFARWTRARVWHVPNAISERFFALPRAPEPRTILFAGVVSPRKAVYELVQAVARVRRSLPDVRLRIAGDMRPFPDYVARIRQLVAEQGLEENVRFLGPLPESDILAEYARAAALALPSWQETLPAAVAQAMAAGVPVVATAVGGVPDVVQDGQTGLLVRPGDVAGLADALLRALTDAPLAKSVADAARAYAEANFRSAGVAQRVLDVYADVLRLERGDGERSSVP
ncbi:MAG: hypothetical protein Kow00123_02620 [Anaerolineales bacterium]